MTQRTVATNLTDLHREPSFLSEMLTQVLHGMSMRVLEEREQWCRVHIEDGYEGWAYRPFLSDEPAQAPTHMVVSPFIEIYATPRREGIAASRLMAGTRVRIVEATESFSRWAPLGSILPGGWLDNNSLRALSEFPLPPTIARQQILDDARSLTGVYYLWGGNTAFGTDCSGLTWLTHRLAGYDIPRDAHPQFHCELAQPVEPPFEPGDLLYFRSDRDPERIGHVGISTGGWQMIHSSRSRNGVYEENVQESEGLKRSFAGARRFLAAPT